MLKTPIRTNPKFICKKNLSKRYLQIFDMWQGSERATLRRPKYPSLYFVPTRVYGSIGTERHSEHLLKVLFFCELNALITKIYVHIC